MEKLIPFRSAAARSGMPSPLKSPTTTWVGFRAARKSRRATKSGAAASGRVRSSNTSSAGGYCSGGWRRAATFLLRQRFTGCQVQNIEEPLPGKNKTVAVHELGPALLLDQRGRQWLIQDGPLLEENACPGR